MFSSIISLTLPRHTWMGLGRERAILFSVSATCRHLRSHSICPSHVSCPFCPSLPQSPFEVILFRFYIPGQKQMRRPEDITCGNALNGLHLLGLRHGTRHFPGLISFIVTTALWDGDHYETTILWRRKRRLQVVKDLSRAM